MEEFWQGVLFETVIRFQKQEKYGKILFLNVNEEEYAQVLGVFENYILTASYFPSINEIQGVFFEDDSLELERFSFKINDKIYYNSHYDFKVEGEQSIIINLMFKKWSIDDEQINEFINENFPCIGKEGTA